MKMSTGIMMIDCVRTVSIAARSTGDALKKKGESIGIGFIEGL